MISPAYQIEHIYFAYPNSTDTALSDISLEIPNGAAMALLGPNGAGKSTLLNILLRWKKPNSGTLALFGKELTSYSHAEISHLISLVPQEEQSQFSFTVLDYVLFGRAPHIDIWNQPQADDLAMAHHALKEVGLAPLADRMVTELSGGEHQLLLLARAIAQEARIMLLDEPTSSLDPANTAKVVAILKKLHERGMTLLFTTHDPSLAAELATHAVLLKQGHLIAAGTVFGVLQAQTLSHLYDTPMQTVMLDGRMRVFRTS